MINKTLNQFKNQAFHDGKFITVDNESIRGKWSVLFFYPADFTFVCPTELEDLANSYEEFKKEGVEIYSVSTDTHFSHKAWFDSSETIRKIKYPMMADPTGSLTKHLGIYDEESGLSRRGTFLINPDGLIKLVEITDDGIGRNSEELLRKIKAAIFISKNPGEVCPAKWNAGGKTLKPGLDLVGKI